jgi:hypothetical protein
MPTAKQRTIRQASKKLRKLFYACFLFVSFFSFLGQSIKMDDGVLDYYCCYYGYDDVLSLDVVVVVTK